MTTLQVLICTLGQKGLDRVSLHSHPTIQGVEYIVSLQNPGNETIIVPQSLQRSDFKISEHESIGLSLNRNHAIGLVDAPLAMISDDDVDYDIEGLKAVIEAFERNPDTDILTFQFESPCQQKRYWPQEFDYDNAPRGHHYVSSIEIAFRNIAGVRFDERFGLGARFLCGEEQLFIHDALKSGLKTRFIPICVSRHDGLSTGQRQNDTPAFIEAHGAMMRLLHPSTYQLRLVVHAWRHRRAGGKIGILNYFRHAMNGAIKVMQLNRTDIC